MTTPPPLPNPKSRPNSAHDLSKAALLLGGFGALFLLFGVQQTSVFGETCYHFGEISMNTVCLQRELYLGGWVVSVGLILFGILQTIRSAGQGS